jgi:hypothetical protein
MVSEVTESRIRRFPDPTATGPGFRARCANSTLDSPGMLISATNRSTFWSLAKRPSASVPEGAVLNETTRKAADQTAQTTSAMSETAERASRAASEAVRRNADAFSNTWRTIVTSGMQNVSGEWMRFMQNRVEENLKRFDEMMSCRTVHDCFAIQAQIARDNCEAFLQTARLTSELSTKLADDAVKQMSDAALAPR